MTELLLAQTSLPNLHPALVHLPLGLAPVALLADAWLLARRRAHPDLERAVAGLWALTLLGATAAWAAGRQAASGLGPLAQGAESALARHADAAQWALAAVALTALMRAAATRSPGARRAPRALRAAGLGMAGLACALLLRTADLGGSLVFGHAVAVVEVPAPGPARPPGAQAVPTPAAGPAPTVSPLRLDLAGGARWSLGPRFRDGVVEALLDASDFSGRAGVGLRVDPDGDGVLLMLDREGRFALLERRGGRDTALDQGRVEPRPGPHTLSLAAAGRHWRGFLDGEQIAHGHLDLPRSGAAVVWLDGSGSVSVLGAEARSESDPEAGGTPASPGGNDLSLH